MYFLDTYFDLGDLGPFLFFLLFMALNIISDKKRKQKRRQRQTDIPPIIDNPTPKIPRRKKVPIDIVNINTKEQEKPKVDITKVFQDLIKLEVEETKSSEHNIETTVYTEKPKISSLPLTRENNDTYATKESSNYTSQNIVKPQATTVDFIQQQEIKSLGNSNNLQIDIEKKHIMQAITYAQVLEQPKSLEYLKRFGIRRVVHKD